MLRPIPEANLKHLKDYRHSAIVDGWLDNKVLTPFWNTLAKGLPDWLAPNVLTVCGNAANVVASILVFVNCPGLDCSASSAPRSMYLTIALCFFTWQTLDALDGKQARRLGCGSALGQLFDHGCDGFTWPHFFVALFAAGGFGLSWRLTGSLTLMLLTVFIGYWEARHCGALVWSEGASLGQILAMIICLSVYFFGHGPLLYKVVGEISVMDIIAVGGMRDPAQSAVMGILRVYQSPTRYDGAFIELGFCIMMIVCCLILFYSTAGQSRLVLFLVFLISNFALSHLANRQTIHDVAKLKMNPVEWTLVPLPLVTAWSVLRPDLASLVLSVYFVGLFVAWLVFVLGVTRQILWYLDIYMWKVVPKKDD